MIVEHAAGGDDDEGRHDAGQQRAEERVDLAELDVVDVHALVHHGRLLEENLPGRDGRADVGHDERDQRRHRHDCADVELGAVEPSARPAAQPSATLPVCMAQMAAGM